MRTWANAGENPNLLTLAFAFAAIGVVGVSSWLLLKKLGCDGAGAAYATAVFVLAVTNTGVLVSRFPFAQLILVVASTVIAIMVYRLRGLGLMRGLLAWGAFVALIFPAITVVGRYDDSSDVDVRSEADLVVAPMTSTPDVLLIVVDAYAGKEVLADLYSYDNSGFIQALERLGFDADGSTIANYARTPLSVPSVLQLDYLGGETSVSKADTDSLLSVMGGESNLAHALKDQGYRQVYVESGWLGTRCGATVDVCIPARWPDETFYDVAYRSVLRDLPGFELGRPFTEGALHTVGWLGTDLAPFLDDDRPDLIYVHLLIPHPPLFLDEECRPNWRQGLPGYAIGELDMTPGGLRAARDGYVAQVECVNTVLLEAAQAASPDDVVLMFGDHGPDSLGQLFTPPVEWSGDQIRERFGVFYAARVPGCDMSRIGSLVNLGRRMMSCLGTTEFPDLPTRILDLHRSEAGNRIGELSLPESLVTP